MTVQLRLEKLRLRMKEAGIDIYLVPTADFHLSEEIGAYFKTVNFLTGFSGSTGTVVITQEKAGLWTDGRYFLQAENELAGTGVSLFKIGERDDPTIEQFITSCICKKGTLGFDGRVISLQEGRSLHKVLQPKQAMIHYHIDLIDEIWKNRPLLSQEQVFSLPIKFSGQSVTDKLARVRQIMRQEKANVHIITSLDDIAWLFNIRGKDMDFSPLVLSFAVITLKQANLYIDGQKIGRKIKGGLEKSGVIFHPYADIYHTVQSFTSSHIVWMDPLRTNYTLYCRMADEVEKIEKPNPTLLFKAQKNGVEIKNIKNAHLKDGIVHTQFIYWLKQQLGKEKITEMTASAKLESLRGAQPGFIRPSFAPICAYAEHGAIVHYQATTATDSELKPGNFFLTDTGGGYFEGSTDITRTIALGEISPQMKTHYTWILQGLLRLANAKFLYGCSGSNLDILARAPLWKQNLNYNHGTGHGVGYLLNIHEAPTSIRWQIRANENHCLEDGMILTDEPGIYCKGAYGIRLENELLVRKGAKNEAGQFMYFEPLTYVPFDKEAIQIHLLTEEDKTFLNDYHNLVYHMISPHLNKKEAHWLRQQTSKI